MKPMTACLTLGCLGVLTTAGCLQDYDDFSFGAGGAPPTTSAGTTSGPGPTTTGTGTTVTGTATVTSTTTNTVTTNTVTTNTVTTAMSSSTGMPGTIVDCDGMDCDVSSNNCCIDGSQNGSCGGGNCGNDIDVECDEHADCPGQICCLFENNGDTVSVECAATCDGFDADPICGNAGDPACQDPTTCTDVDDLPGGYQSCQ